MVFLSKIIVVLDIVTSRTSLKTALTASIPNPISTHATHLKAGSANSLSDSFVGGGDHTPDFLACFTRDAFLLCLLWHIDSVFLSDMPRRVEIQVTVVIRSQVHFRHPARVQHP
jgi:hypothetical protein